MLGVGECICMVRHGMALLLEWTGEANWLFLIRIYCSLLLVIYPTAHERRKHGRRCSLGIGHMYKIQNNFRSENACLYIVVSYSCLTLFLPHRTTIFSLPPVIHKLPLLPAQPTRNNTRLTYRLGYASPHAVLLQTHQPANRAPTRRAHLVL